jgi:hypothetical protein
MFTKVTRIALAVMVTGAGLATASSAGAASFRDIKSVKYNRCLYAYGDPLEDIYDKNCNTTPAQFGNWSVVNVGSYNRHALWFLRRQNGTCLGVSGTAENNYLYSTCDAKGSKNVWEVFPTTAGVDPVVKTYVLKSFGAFQSWGQHKCLTFSGPMGIDEPQLGACSTTSTADMIYR